jgi:hypothetical protein
VPVADAGIGLPGIRPDFVHTAALQIQRARALLAIPPVLTGVDRFHAAAVAFGADVVVMRQEAEPVSVERDAAIGVEKIRLMLVDQIFDAVESTAVSTSPAPHGPSPRL